MRENMGLKIIPMLINILLVGLMAYFIKETDSDKSPIIFLFLYPLLLLVNLLLLLIFWGLKKPAIVQIFKMNMALLLILIIPMIVFICFA